MARSNLTRAQLEGIARLNVCPPILWACDWPRRRHGWLAWVPLALAGAALAWGAVAR